MQLGRVLRHLSYPSLRARRAFPARVMDAVESAIRASETHHRGELRFAVESALDWPELWRETSATQRAREVFGKLGVWDTAENNGVLIYLLLADHAVEIVADHGFAAWVEPAQWQTICRDMEREFRAGRFEAGALGGIAAISELMAKHYPASGERANPDELPNRPVVL
ncbi:MAG: TPM domain-containing protein [Kiritimatiellae bacterium]|nr:TPM domain-containing protein [Kiritimatiellia bacterium]